MEYNWAALTDVGVKREKNQDTFLVNPELGLFIVADGMGGHKGGDVASALASQAIQDIVEDWFFSGAKETPQEILAKAYSEASRQINEISSANIELSGMGTTLVAALFHNEMIHLANVGDSRAYLLRKDGLWQVTEDHSLLYDQLKAGLISEEDVPNFMAKNIITRSVGFEDRVSCDFLSREIIEGERYLLCSDGLSGLVSDQSISEKCKNEDLHKTVRELVEEAKTNGGDDNITVVLVGASL